MKTRFTLTSLTLASLLMASTAAMAGGSSNGNFNVTMKLTGQCAAITVDGGSAALAADSAEKTGDAITNGADINFGDHVAISGAAAVDGSSKGSTTSGIKVICSKNMPFNITLDSTNKTNSTGEGLMKGVTNGNTDEIGYQLYKPTIENAGTWENTIGTSSNYSDGDKWGKDANALTLRGKGYASPIVIPVFARVPAGSLDKYLDRYQDRVNVTLSW
ncbi:MAG: spore coat protein U domain-containing protein [Neisseria sicca]|jgi:putative lipoprotein|uniref:Spore coat protein U domain-containing protein n=1 Tax=Neisseria sicca TaxID=490 RepID=A0A930DJZ3_NEISI|nr:spore coat protein U domain-containing protein [Neisseria sicca]MBF1265252.1 spore coat protein U domain-containing protein [Neisseria sicca]